MHFCSSAGTVFDNPSWSAPAGPGIVAHTAGPTAANPIGASAAAGTRSATGAVAGLTSTSPAGTVITDFSTTRQLD